MSKIAIYEAVLKQMAEGGNEQAKFALAAAENVADADVVGTTGHLKEALAALQQALRENGIKWSHATDTYVTTASDRITSAMRCLIR